MFQINGIYSLHVEVIKVVGDIVGARIWCVAVYGFLLIKYIPSCMV